MNHETPDNKQPVHGQIDPTSIPGSPDFVPSAEFAEQIAQPSAMSHQEQPEERVVAVEGLATVEEIQAKKTQQIAVYGAIGMAAALGGKGVLASMQPGLPENAEVIHTVLDQHVTPMVMILGGILVLNSTIRAEIHRNRAQRARSVFDNLH